MGLHEYIEQFRSLLTQLLTNGNVEIVRAERDLYQIIEKLDKEYGEEGVAEFSKLFNIKDDNIGAYSARYLLGCIHPSRDITVKALSVMEQYADGPAVNADFFREWLVAYYANHINEETYRNRKRIFQDYSLRYAALLLVLTVSTSAFCYWCKTANLLLIMFANCYLANIVYFYLLERKLKKGIQNKTALAGLIILGTPMLSACIMWLFTHFSIINKTSSGMLFELIQYIVNTAFSIFIAWRFWLRNSWAGRKLPLFEGD